MGFSWVGVWGGGPWERQAAHGGVLVEGGAVLRGCLLPADPRPRLGQLSGWGQGGVSSRQVLAPPVARSLWWGPVRDFRSLSLSFPPRRHICLLARAQGRWPAGRGHPGVSPGAGGDHEGPAAAGPGPSPTAPRYWALPLGLPSSWCGWAASTAHPGPLCHLSWEQKGQSRAGGLGRTHRAHRLCLLQMPSCSTTLYRTSACWTW